MFQVFSTDYKQTTDKAKVLAPKGSLSCLNMRKFFSIRSQQENTAAELMGETEDNPEEFPIKSATVQPQTPVSAPTTLVTSGETTPNAKPAFKSIKPNIKKTVIGNTTSDEPVVTRPKHRRTHSGFDQVTLENKVFTYEIEGLGKFEYNGTVDQNGVVRHLL
jgi:hypothetical protein